MPQKNTSSSICTGWSRLENQTKNSCKYITERLIVLQELELENSHASTPSLHIYCTNYWFAQIINSITAYRYMPPLKK